MAGTTHYDWWMISRMVRNIARNMRITGPIVNLAIDELTPLRTFLKSIWNPVTQTGTRSWLETSFRKISASGSATCNIDTEPAANLVRMLEVVGRDLKKIPVTDAEITLIGTFLSGIYVVRALGSGPLFGGVIGSLNAV